MCIQDSTYRPALKRAFPSECAQCVGILIVIFALIHCMERRRWLVVGEVYRHAVVCPVQTSRFISQDNNSYAQGPVYWNSDGCDYLSGCVQESLTVARCSVHETPANNSGVPPLQTLISLRLLYGGTILYRGPHRLILWKPHACSFTGRN